MIISSIRLKNFLVHEDNKIYFNRGINVITGQNGSGKSSIVQAIYYALFGKALYYNSAKEFIRYGRKDFEIELEIIEDDRVITIKRGKDASTFSSDVYQIKGPNELKNYLYTQYNLNAKRYESTLLIKQNSIDEFILTTPNNRLKEFEKIIGIDILKKVLEANEEIIKDIERDIKAFDYEGRKKEIEEKEKEIEKLILESEKKIYEREIVEREIENLENEKESLKRLSNLYNKLLEIQEKEIEIGQLKMFLEENKRLFDDYENYQKIYRDAIEVKNAVSDLQKLKDEMNNLQTYKEGYEMYKLYLEWNEREDVKDVEQSFKRGNEIGNEIERIFGTKNEKEIQQIITNLKERKESLLRRKENILEEMGAISSEIDQNRDILKIKNFQGLCPLCKRPLSDEHKQTLIDEANIKIKILEDRKKLLNDEKQKIEKEIKILEDKLKMEKKVEEYINLKRHFNVNLWNEWMKVKRYNTKENRTAYEQYSKKPSIESQMEEKEKKIKNWNKGIDYEFVIDYIEKNKNFYNEYLKKRTQFESLKNEVLKKDDILKEIEKIKAQLNIYDISKVEETIKIIEMEIGKRRETLGEIKKHIEKNEEIIKKYREDVEKIKVEIEKNERNRENLSFYREISNRLERLINYERKRYYEKLKFIVKHYFDSFGLNDYKNVDIEFNEDGLNLYLIDESGNRYEARYLSGGERTAFSLSFRLAIAQMLDIKFKILILDEPTEGMDEMRVLNLKELFSYFISKNTDYQMIIITHEDELSDIANNRIHLERFNNRSIVYN